MLRYVGDGCWVPGYPTYDIDEETLTADEIALLLETGVYELEDLPDDDLCDDCFDSVSEEEGED